MRDTFTSQPKLGAYHLALGVFLGLQAQLQGILFQQLFQRKIILRVLLSSSSVVLSRYHYTITASSQGVLDIGMLVHVLKRCDSCDVLGSTEMESCICLQCS